MFCKSQVDGKEKIIIEGTYKDQVIYITGTTKVAGYSVETRTCNASSLNIGSKTPAPILQVYIATKNNFVGEIMTNEKGKKTKITDIKLEPTPTGKDNIFTVVGKDFSMGFKLVDGFILLEEKSTIVFYTDGVGVWKVNRKI
jgi:hypothetical protein